MRSRKIIIQDKPKIQYVKYVNLVILVSTPLNELFSLTKNLINFGIKNNKPNDAKTIL